MSVVTGQGNDFKVKAGNFRLDIKEVAFYNTYGDTLE